MKQMKPGEEMVESKLIKIHTAGACCNTLVVMEGGEIVKVFEGEGRHLEAIQYAAWLGNQRNVEKKKGEKK